MISFKNDQALIQFWINCWLQSRLTRLTDNGWAPVPTENRGRSVWHTKSSELSITPLHETKNTVLLTVDGYRLNSCSHREQELWKKWNESGFRPPLCTYRLNWARRTSWGWWDDWDDTVLQTQDSKFEPWRSEAEHATSRSRRLPTILTFTREWGRKNFVSFKPPRPGTEPRTLAWKAAVLTTTLGPPPRSSERSHYVWHIRQWALYHSTAGGGVWS